MFGFGKGGQDKPPFGQSASSPFGTSSFDFGQPQTAFGSSFGAATPAFGSASSPQTSTFGSSTSTSMFDSVAPSFGTAGGALGTKMEDEDMGQTQTTSFPPSSGFGTSSGSGFSASSPLFGRPEQLKGFMFGKRPDTPMSDSPIMGKSASERAPFGKNTFAMASNEAKKEAPQTFASTPMFSSAVAKPLPSLFGKPPTLEQQTSSLFAAPASAGSETSSLFGKTSSYGPTDTSNVFTSTASSGPYPSTLFGKSITDKKPVVAQKRSLFGKAIEATMPKIKEEIAEDEPRSRDLLTSSDSQKTLFGKSGHSDTSLLFGPPSDTSNIFCKTTKSETPTLFGKSVQSETSSLFGKPVVKSDSSALFGKSALSDSSTLFWRTLQSDTPVSGVFGKSPPSSSVLFGKKEGDSQTKSLFGKIKSETSGLTRTIKNEPIDKTDEIKSEPTESFVPVLSSNVFGRLKEEAPVTLFGKSEPSTSFQHNSEEPASGSSKVLGKPATLTAEAARRSVKKSLSPHRSISAADETKDVPTNPCVGRPQAYKSDDISRRVAIVVENLPAKVNNRETIKRFFHKFGTVRKVFSNVKSKKATVHFDDHESAAQAMRHGYDFAGGVRIVWSPYVLPRRAHVPRDQAAEPSTSYDADTSRSVDPDRPTVAVQDRVCRTAKEKADFLNEVEKRMRADQKQQTRLDRTEVVVGTCKDMCPERERYVREEQRRLHPFEMIKTEDQTRGSYYVNHAKAVKEYSRSSADQDEPLPHELRPPQVLAKTMDYLVVNIMDKHDDTSWTEWYDFLWNRTRSIRKDITQQHLCDMTAVDLLEKCTRFHIFSGMRLCELSMMEFDQKINSENLTKCLQTLKELYIDLKVRHNVVCQNEPEFRGYMVLMKVNEGDILREVQTYPDNLRRSQFVQFAVQVHQTVSSNNYVRFFKLVRRTTFLNACLMFRYFTQVRVAALLTIMKAFRKKGGLPYPIEDLRRQLGFEDDDDVVRFCDDHGLEEAYGAIIMERKTFVEPEAGCSVIRRPKLLIESKNTGLIGEIVQGAPLPNYIPLEPTFSFDSEGRYLGLSEAMFTSVPAATSSPSPSSDATSVRGFSASPIKFVVKEEAMEEIEHGVFSYTKEDVKFVARELFLEVIDEILPEMCRSLMANARTVEESTRHYADILLSEQVITIVREICEEVVRDEQRIHDKQSVTLRLEQMEHERQRQELERQRQDVERQRQELERERQEMERQRQEMERQRREMERQRDELVNEISGDVIGDVMNDLVRSTVLTTYSDAKEEQRHKQMDEVAENIMDDLLRRTTDDLVAELADEINAKCVRKKVVNQLCERMRTFRKYKYWRKWREWHRRCVRQKDTVANFPVCSSMETEEVVVTCLSPATRKLGMLDDSIHVTTNARLTSQSAATLESMRCELQQKVTAVTRFADLNRKWAWKPLDLVSIVAWVIEKEAENLQKGIAMKYETDLYWKLLVVLPDLSKDDDSTLSEWICQKLRRGAVPDDDNEFTRLLSFYRSTASLPDGGAVRVHVCIRTVQRSMFIDAELDVLSGTSGVMIVVSPHDTELDIFEMANDVVCDLSDTKGIPVSVICCREADFLDSEKQKLMKEFAVGDDLEDTKASIHFCRGLTWLLKHRPLEPPLIRSPIRKFVDDFLAREFFGPVYVNLNERRKNGLLHQPPNVLLALYQSAINHLAEVVCEESYAAYLWPAPEFASHDSGLPEYGWNSPDHLQYVKDVVLSLSLPDFDSSDPDSDLWSSACQDVWEFVRNLVDDGKDPTSLCSRIEQCIRTARCSFEKTCFLSEQLVGCEPMYGNMPWAEIVSAVVDHQLVCLDWYDPVYTETEYPVELCVVYDPVLLNGYKPPKSWTMALRMPDSRLPQPMDISQKDTVVKSAKRKLESTADESETHSIKRSYVIDTTIDNSRQTHCTASNVYEMKSRVAAEAAYNDRLLEYMEQSVLAHDAFLQTGDRSFLSPVRSNVRSLRIDSPQTSRPLSGNSFHQRSGGFEQEIRYNSKIDTSCLPEDLRSKVDEILNERRLDDTMDEITRRLEDEERATSIQEMKVNLMLNETQPNTLIENTELNVLSNASPKPPSMLRNPPK